MAYASRQDIQLECKRSVWWRYWDMISELFRASTAILADAQQQQQQQQQQDTASSLQLTRSQPEDGKGEDAAAERNELLPSTRRSTPRLPARSRLR
jgi:hypothetical protein